LLGTCGASSPPAERQSVLDAPRKRHLEHKKMALNPVFIILAACLICLSGIFSGLNLGLMSLAPDDLQIVIEGSPSEKERRDASRIMPLRSRGNLLLCTLLLGNTLVNAAIAVLLADATDGIIGTVLTTGLIMIFGEIIPQSVCSRYALSLGARSVPLVWLFVVACFVVTWPISKVLDYVLGGEVSADYTKGELRALVKMNVEDPKRREECGLTEDDGRILAGALQFKDALVDSAMTPIDSVLALPETSVLDKLTMERILKSGHTRIPVTAEGNDERVVGVLYAKDLVGVGSDHALPLKRVLDAFQAARRVHEIDYRATLGEAFEHCKKCRVHLMVVVDKTRRDWPMVGVVTSEDILEELLQEEIVGDDDMLIDDAAASTRRPGVPRKNSKAYDPCALIRTLS